MIKLRMRWVRRKCHKEFYLEDLTKERRTIKHVRKCPQIITRFAHSLCYCPQTCRFMNNLKKNNENAGILNVPSHVLHNSYGKMCPHLNNGLESLIIDSWKTARHQSFSIYLDCWGQLNYFLSLSLYLTEHIVCLCYKEE